jgi:hypothetical protein
LKETAIANSRQYPGIFMERLRKTKDNVGIAGNLTEIGIG